MDGTPVAGRLAVEDVEALAIATEVIAGKARSYVGGALTLAHALRRAMQARSLEAEARRTWESRALVAEASLRRLSPGAPGDSC